MQLYFETISTYKTRLSLSSHQESSVLCRAMPTILLQRNDFQLPEGLYITAWPNHGAGIGHQFGEWFQGIWAAYKFNITYVHTPFLINSAYWNSFLGFGANEIGEDDIKIHHYIVTVL
ncbi:unnamed protein product [Rotaria magnacalcarata]|uniref:Uncharacterized protein n=1 Tax=Rotaria magnacalcarata TaxID=392030 RepID=A0A820DM00_9BILA|nr:unnamed protein product [Rotaria magnacalcarata]